MAEGEIYSFEVKEGEGGERIDKYITSQLGGRTRSQIQFLILNSSVYLNNNVEKNCGKKIKCGDRINLTIHSKPTTLKPYHINLDVVYEDEDLLVINKPAGLTVHPGANTQNDTLANALIAQFENLSSASGETRPGIVHRLDKNTSGLMLVAKNNETHLYLCGQIMERKVKRKYLALTYGVPNPVMGQIATNIAPCKKDPTKMRVVGGAVGKIAVTNYRVLKVFENRMFSLVECELETGRTHQIRVHMKYKNNPIVGDQKYAIYYNFNVGIVSSQVVEEIRLLGRQALHAHQLMFYHPKTQKPMIFEIPIDRKIKSLIDLLQVDR
ncbi:RluA family pseudouridine synthase [Candidatus Bandiella euplotis]|uniref:Pseudouridine synthase n=1 Tax=Candidatus Bandiella euplotis TaxID=1664265 RepID=A0ABZ0UP95_9RICK|nr:RluA family pseudouridine synthase [Candidatus Bandiella woodruffii]WPX96523.1 RluA family ribosomal large subunit pseudouridine synthase [Candidatus Bandiella woodruffii]